MNVERQKWAVDALEGPIKASLENNPWERLSPLVVLWDLPELRLTARHASDDSV